MIAYGITKEQLENEIRNGNVHYNWSSRDVENKNNFDLFITLHGNHGYRVATYSKTTKRIILTCPYWHIPNEQTLEKFIELCQNKEVLNE